MWRIRVLRTLSLGTASQYIDSHISNKLARLFEANSALIGQIYICYRILFKTLRASLVHKRPDGLFHDVLDDPSTFVGSHLS